MPMFREDLNRVKIKLSCQLDSSSPPWKDEIKDRLKVSNVF